MIDQGEISNRKFTKMLEEAIRQANHEVIDPMLPPLSMASILPVAVMVAKLRGRYLAETYKMVEGKKEGYPDSAQMAQLKQYREEYEEALAASQALEHAIDRGYLELGDA